MPFLRDIHRYGHLKTNEVWLDRFGRTMGKAKREAWNLERASEFAPYSAGSDKVECLDLRVTRQKCCWHDRNQSFHLRRWRLRPGWGSQSQTADRTKHSHHRTLILDVGKLPHLFLKKHLLSSKALRLNVV